MKIHNALPLFTQCLKRWKEKPLAQDFNEQYLSHIEAWLKPMLDDFNARWKTGLYSIIEGLNWELYRKEALTLDPKKEESRVQNHLKDVEMLLKSKLKGEIVLFGAFTAMDGYARFHKGTHRVFLGVDESHAKGAYLDILITHELTHVARESVPNIWKELGLKPKMTHDEFTENLPVTEHLFSEGYSCAVSEILNPNADPWHYAYQTQESLSRVFEHGPTVDKIIHEEIQKENAGDYGHLYDMNRYLHMLPRFAHYVWAWQWVKQLIRTEAKGDPYLLLKRCSKDFISNAMEFKL